MLGTRRQSDSVLWNQSRSLYVRLSVCCLCVCPSVTKCSQDWIISFFFHILHFDTWSWYLMTDKARFFNKKNGGSNLGLMGLNQAQNKVFRHLLEFGSYAFLEIAQNDSFRQCLSSSRGEIHEKKKKNWGPNLGQTGQNQSQN